jgi:hypothetical protein
MRSTTKSAGKFEEDRLAIQQELEHRLGKNVSAGELADKIARLLKLLGRKAGTVESVARYLAKELAPWLTRKSYELQRLIKCQPEQLLTLADSALWDEVEQLGIPALVAQKKIRKRITTEQERIRRTKAAKNRYERFRRSHVTTPGSIELHFGEWPDSILLYPFEGLPPSGPCLDDVFHGDHIQMCNGTYSLQSLFGLRRKKLSAAGHGNRRGRKIVYDYHAVLCCMVALLKQTGQAAPWLPDGTRRRIVLAGILLRARQEATPEISDAFAKELGPYLN